ncbi:MAG: methyltransferase domain-containing protein [Bacteroidota bacterium]
MKTSSSIFLGAFLLTSGFLQSQDAIYTFKKGDYSGIGKWFMGREIAHVMGFQGMSWLERRERESEEKTTTLLKNMNIGKTDHIADIGAGSGYHVFKMAKMATEGIVYAVDIQKEMISAMKIKKEAGGYTNVRLVQGTETEVNLAPNSLDKVLIVDVYHEMSYPVEMMQSIKVALKPKGEIYLIEYRGEDPKVPIKRLHKMTEAQAARELSAIGFELKENIANLPWQHCMVFVKR